MKEEYDYFKKATESILSKPFDITEIEKKEVLEFSNSDNLEEALNECFSLGLEEGNGMYVYEDDWGDILCVFGIVRTPVIHGKAATPWLLSAKDFKPTLDFIRQSKKVVNEDMFTDGVKVLANYIHKDNTKSIKWLTWLGFKFTLHPWKDDYLQFYKYK